ncbi:MAG: hypothetical protein WA690_03140 [Candidatus Acidiferrales bacterium]
MGSGYSWIESGSYYQGFFPGPVGPPNQPNNPDVIGSASVGASVADNAVAPQIQPGAPYQQPGTDAPADNPQVDASSAIAMPGPNVIEPGAVFVQPDTANPEDNAQVDASTARAGANAPNQIAGSGAWQGNYIQPGS